MKTFMVEFTNLVTGDPFIEIIHAENDGIAWDIAYEKSNREGLAQGDYSMYCVLRNPNGYLYLADMEGIAIRSEGGTYLI